MADYTVIAGCGHTQQLQLYGKQTERRRRLEWMQSPTGKCNPCYAAYKRAQEAEAEQQALEQEVAAKQQALEREASHIAQYLLEATPEQVEQFRQSLRQAEIVGNPWAAVGARALALYQQAIEA